MSAPIDHIVICVHELDAAAARFEQAGFTLTPRALHPWGTANRLVQFSGQNFIELLEIAAPDKIFPHDFAVEPKRFSFGAFNRDFLAAGEGMSMLVLASSDARADMARFKAAGLDVYEPFAFERSASLPGGGQVKVAFELAFATHAKMPRAAFFTCHNRFPENFWKRKYQQHANGAAGITEVVLVAREPKDIVDFAQGFCASVAAPVDGGFNLACAAHRLSILRPDAYESRFDVKAPQMDEEARFAAVTIERTRDNDLEDRIVLPGALVVEWKEPNRPSGELK